MSQSLPERSYEEPTYDAGTGWLTPGRYDFDFDDLDEEFVTGRGDVRRGEILAALDLLLSCVKELIPSGYLMISGTFVSNQPGPGPCDRPTIAVVPHDPSTLTTWTDAEDERFTGYLSLHDVIIGSLDAMLMPVLHPISGLLEVLYCDPSDAEIVAGMMGATTLADGTEIVGARGILEVEW